ncbi:MAG: hypothetical protein PGN09_09105 [Sphingomonas fennica]
MIASRFRSVWMVAGVATAALCCYLVSQRVATERAELARVERQIGQTRKDIRMLTTEIVTRTRMPQLERWNVAVLGLTAPGAGQFLDSEVRLASLDAPAPLPLDPAIVASQGAVRTVAFTPAAAPHAAAPDRVADAPAAPPQPLLRQATYLRPKPGAIVEGPAIAPLAVKVVLPAAPRVSASLLPEDIGSLADLERDSGSSARR